MQIKSLFFCTFFLIVLSCPSQGQTYYNQSPEFLKSNNIWIFGDRAGLDFNSGQPLSFVDSSGVPGNPNSGNIGTQIESPSVVADPLTGELLFYFDGQNCRNRNHKIMPNGGDFLGIISTTLQGSVITPVVGHPGQYYLFTLFGISGFYGNGADSSGGMLFYSKIDMNLDNGLGDVVPGQRTIVLDRDTLSESMIAVQGENCDIWLMVHTTRDPKFKAYHITTSGIDPDPVVSETGTQIKGTFYGDAYQLGAMTIAPDRKRIAISSWNPSTAYIAELILGYIPDDLGVVGVLLCKFDPATGKVSDGLVVGKNISAYGLAFSPDNSKLYMAYHDSRFPMGELLQFDVQNFDAKAIASSKTTIGQIPTVDLAQDYLRLYRDTIYINHNAGFSFLSTINQPNRAGLSCNYQEASVTLAPGTQTGLALPNEVVFIPSLALPVITVDVFELSTTLPYSHYQWLYNGTVIPGANSRTYMVAENGNYSVVVSNDAGCRDTAATYEVRNVTGIDSRALMARQIAIYPIPATEMVYIKAPLAMRARLTGMDGRVIQEIQKATAISIAALANGMYLLQLMDDNGNLLKVEKIIKKAY